MSKKNKKPSAHKTPLKKQKGVPVNEVDELFRVFSALTSKGIIVHKNGIIIEANDIACKMVGLPKKKVIGSNALNILVPDQKQKVLKRFKKEAQKSHIIPFISKNGKSVWLEVRGKNIVFKGQPARVTIFNDITDQKLYEEKLKQSEEKFKRLSEATFEAVLIHDNGKLLEYNESAKKIFGYSDKEMAGKSVLDFATPETRNEVLEKMRSGFTKAYEAGGLRKNGTSFYGEVRARDFIMPDGKRIRVGAVRDITERKIVEQNLKESESNLSLILNNIEEMVYFVEFDKKGRQKVKYLGSQIEKLFGINREEYIKSANTLIRFCHPDDVPVIKKNYEEIKKGKTAKAFCYRFKHKIKKEYVWIEERIIPQLNAKGDHVGNFGVLRDVTESKQREQEVNRSKENYRNLIEYSPDGIFIHDEKGIILFSNPSMLHMMGITSLSDLTEKQVMAYLPSDYQRIVKKRKALMDKGMQIDFSHMKIKRADAKIIDIESKSIPIEFDGKKATLVVCHNLTLQQELTREQMRAQLAEETNTQLKEEIRERESAEEKLKESLTEKEVLLKEVHHRVKNNMQVISSILNLQSSYVKDQNTLDLLKESQNRIKSMAFVHESLYLNKDLSSINFADYVVNLAKNLIHSFSVYDGQIELELDVEEVRLNLDAAIPTGLIINELVSNAFKYAFPDKRQGKVLIALKQEKEFIHLTVSDDGVGLPARVDFRNTESLGLQLVTTLVDQLDGRIELDKTKGSKFIITFNKK